MIENLGSNQLQLSRIQEFNDTELEDSESKQMQSKTAAWYKRVPHNEQIRYRNH